MTGAANHRGSSKQNYGTPREYLDAVERKIDRICFDLAAEESNAVCPRYFTKEQDALAQDWTQCGPGLLWLNPPFANIAPWSEKCMKERVRGCDIAFLVPASVGAKWFADFVWGWAFVYFNTGRLSFDGKNPFPKDTMLCVYSGRTGAEPWDWRNESAATPNIHLLPPLFAGVGT